MQHEGLRYSQGANNNTHQVLPFTQNDAPQVQPTGGSLTSALRQFRKKDNVDKHSISNHVENATEENPTPSHVARVAPHNHYPAPRQDEYYRYPQYAPEFPLPCKETTQVKYSEISDPQAPIQHMDHLGLSKHKEKEYMEMCNIPQQTHQLKQPYVDHGNRHQNYGRDQTVHPQYLHKEQLPIHSGYKQESQFLHKDLQYQQYSLPKYSMPPQSTRKYSPPGNDFLSHLQRIHPTMARSIMNDQHLRESQSNYTSMEQNRMYSQSQRYYTSSIQPNQPYPNNPNYPYQNASQSFTYPTANPTNYSYKHTTEYSRSPTQLNTPSVPKFQPQHVECNVSPRRNYAENLSMQMNYMPPHAAPPQKISPNYTQYNSPEYAQHYQLRRPAMAPKDYYHHQASYRPGDYLQSHHMLQPSASSSVRDETSADPHHPPVVTVSNSIKHYLENWAEEENPADSIPTIDNTKYIYKENVRVRGDDIAGEPVYVINSADLPQCLENGIPLVTENGQYTIVKGGVVDNASGIIRIIENTKDPVHITDNNNIVNLHIVDENSPDCMLSGRPMNSQNDRESNETIRGPTNSYIISSQSQKTDGLIYPQEVSIEHKLPEQRGPIIHTNIQIRSPYENNHIIMSNNNSNSNNNNNGSQLSMQDHNNPVLNAEKVLNLTAERPGEHLTTGRHVDHLSPNRHIAHLTADRCVANMTADRSIEHLTADRQVSVLNITRSEETYQQSMSAAQAALPTSVEHLGNIKYNREETEDAKQYEENRNNILHIEHIVKTMENDLRSPKTDWAPISSSVKGDETSEENVAAKNRQTESNLQTKSSDCSINFARSGIRIIEDIRIPRITEYLSENKNNYTKSEEEPVHIIKRDCVQSEEIGKEVPENSNVQPCSVVPIKPDGVHFNEEMNMKIEETGERGVAVVGTIEERESVTDLKTRENLNLAALQTEESLLQACSKAEESLNFSDVQNEKQILAARETEEILNKASNKTEKEFNVPSPESEVNLNLPSNKDEETKQSSKLKTEERQHLGSHKIEKSPDLSIANGEDRLNLMASKAEEFPNPRTEEDPKLIVTKVEECLNLANVRAEERLIFASVKPEEGLNLSNIRIEEIASLTPTKPETGLSLANTKSEERSKSAEVKPEEGLNMEKTRTEESSNLSATKPEERLNVANTITEVSSNLASIKPEEGLNLADTRSEKNLDLTATKPKEGLNTANVITEESPNLAAVKLEVDIKLANTRTEETLNLTTAKHEECLNLTNQIIEEAPNLAATKPKEGLNLTNSRTEENSNLAAPKPKEGVNLTVETEGLSKLPAQENENISNSTTHETEESFNLTIYKREDMISVVAQKSEESTKFTSFTTEEILRSTTHKSETMPNLTSYPTEEKTITAPENADGTKLTSTKTNDVLKFTPSAIEDSSNMSSSENEGISQLADVNSEEKHEVSVDGPQHPVFSDENVEIKEDKETTEIFNPLNEERCLLESTGNLDKEDLQKLKISHEYIPSVIQEKSLGRADNEKSSEEIQQEKSSENIGEEKSPNVEENSSENYGRENSLADVGVNEKEETLDVDINFADSKLEMGTKIPILRGDKTEEGNNESEMPVLEDETIETAVSKKSNVNDINEDLIKEHVENVHVPSEEEMPILEKEVPEDPVAEFEKTEHEDQLKHGDNVRTNYHEEEKLKENSKISGTFLPLNDGKKTQPTEEATSLEQNMEKSYLDAAKNLNKKLKPESDGISTQNQNILALNEKLCQAESKDLESDKVCMFVSKVSEIVEETVPIEDATNQIENASLNLDNNTVSETSNILDRSKNLGEEKIHRENYGIQNIGSSTSSKSLDHNTIPSPIIKAPKMDRLKENNRKRKRIFSVDDIINKIGKKMNHTKRPSLEVSNVEIVPSETEENYAIHDNQSTNLHTKNEGNVDQYSQVPCSVSSDINVSIPIEETGEKNTTEKCISSFDISAVPRQNIEFKNSIEKLTDQSKIENNTLSTRVTEEAQEEETKIDDSPALNTCSKIHEENDPKEIHKSVCDLTSLDAVLCQSEIDTIQALDSSISEEKSNTDNLKEIVDLESSTKKAPTIEQPCPLNLEKNEDISLSRKEIEVEKTVACNSGYQETEDSHSSLREEIKAEDGIASASNGQKKTVDLQPILREEIKIEDTFASASNDQEKMEELPASFGEKLITEITSASLSSDINQMEDFETPSNEEMVVKETHMSSLSELHKIEESLKEELAAEETDTSKLIESGKIEELHLPLREEMASDETSATRSRDLLKNEDLKSVEDENATEKSPISQNAENKRVESEPMDLSDHNEENKDKRLSPITETIENKNKDIIQTLAERCREVISKSDCISNKKLCKLEEHLEDSIINSTKFEEMSQISRDLPRELDDTIPDNKEADSLETNPIFESMDNKSDNYKKEADNNFKENEENLYISEDCGEVSLIDLTPFDETKGEIKFKENEENLHISEDRDEVALDNLTPADETKNEIIDNPADQQSSQNIECTSLPKNKDYFEEASEENKPETKIEPKTQAPREKAKHSIVNAETQISDEQKETDDLISMLENEENCDASSGDVIEEEIGVKEEGSTEVITKNTLQERDKDVSKELNEEGDCFKDVIKEHVEETLEKEVTEENIEKTLEKLDENEDVSTNTEAVQFRNVLKIEENEILIEVGGELMEIVIANVGGKKVISVTPFSENVYVNYSSDNYLDINDNYQNLNHINEETEDVLDTTEDESVVNITESEAKIEEIQMDKVEESVSAEERCEEAKILEKCAENISIFEEFEDSISIDHDEIIEEVISDINDDPSLLESSEDKSFPENNRNEEKTKEPPKLRVYSKSKRANEGAEKVFSFKSEICNKDLSSCLGESSNSIDLVQTCPKIATLCTKAAKKLYATDFIETNVHKTKSSVVKVSKSSKSVSKNVNSAKVKSSISTPDKTNLNRKEKLKICEKKPPPVKRKVTSSKTVGDITVTIVNTDKPKKSKPKLKETHTKHELEKRQHKKNKTTSNLAQNLDEKALKRSRRLSEKHENDTTKHSSKEALRRLMEVRKQKKEKKTDKNPSDGAGIEENDSDKHLVSDVKATLKENQIYVVKEQILDNPLEKLITKATTNLGKPVKRVSFSSEGPEVFYNYDTDEENKVKVANLKKELVTASTTVENTIKKRLTLQEYIKKRQQSLESDDHSNISDNASDESKVTSSTDVCTKRNHDHETNPDETTKDSTDTNEDVAKNATVDEETKDTKKRKMLLINTWEDSPKCASPIQSCTNSSENQCLILNSKAKRSKCIIDMREFDVKSICSNLSSSSTQSANIGETDMLQLYKDEVDLKLNSLNLKIPIFRPQKPEESLETKYIRQISGLALSQRELSESNNLMRRFLNREKLCTEEIAKVRKIISYKRLIEMLHRVRSKQAEPNYELKDEHAVSNTKQLKLHLRKIEEAPRRKRKRFRNLYAADSSDEASSDYSDRFKALGDYSVYQKNSTGVPKLIIKRTITTDLQPVVRLERSYYLDLLAKKRKYS